MVALDMTPHKMQGRPHSQLVIAVVMYMGVAAPQPGDGGVCELLVTDEAEFEVVGFGHDFCDEQRYDWKGCGVF